MAIHARNVYSPISNAEKDLDSCCAASCWKHLSSPVRAQPLSPTLSFGLPSAIQGLRILLLGVGNGQEVFCLANQVGAAGEVFAVTSQREMLEQWRQWQGEFFNAQGFDNLSLFCTSSQSLNQLPLAEASFDLIISLEPKLQSLLFDAPYLTSLLKTGGEWLRITLHQTTRRLAGFSGPFKMASQLPTNSYRATRWFKVHPPEFTSIGSRRLCYNGGIEECPDELLFDNYRLPQGQFVDVPEETYQVLIHSRYRDYLLPERGPNSSGLFAK